MQVKFVLSDQCICPQCILTVHFKVQYRIWCYQSERENTVNMYTDVDRSSLIWVGIVCSDLAVPIEDVYLKWDDLSVPWILCVCTIAILSE